MISRRPILVTMTRNILAKNRADTNEIKLSPVEIKMLSILQMSDVSEFMQELWDALIKDLESNPHTISLSPQQSSVSTPAASAEPKPPSDVKTVRKDKKEQSSPGTGRGSGS